MAGYPTLDDLEVAGQRVLLRADLNVPMHGGTVSDSTRIDRIVPTLQDLVRRGARVAVLSHFGRPKGEARPEYSLAPVAPALAAALGETGLPFAADCIGPAAEACMTGLEPGGIALFENLRFHAGEEANDPAFAQALAAQGDLYINDAFSCAHRAHASTTALAGLLPCSMGRAMEAELTALESALESPARPAAALVGGAKVSTKLAVLGNLIGKVDLLVIGGAMANTFLHAQEVDVGRSLCEPDLAGTARDILEQAAGAGCEVILPADAVVAETLAEGVNSQVAAIDAVPSNMMVLDIGPQGAEAVKAGLNGCKTLLWNGPLGAFETPPFDQATNAVARHAARLTAQGGLVSVAGGGDTAAALAHAGVGDDFTYISSAGGAFLEWLEGKELPGIAALRRD